MAWIVNFKESAKKELSKLDKPVAKKLVQFLQHLSMCEDPRHKGKQLKGKLKEFWRYRVGDCRIITKITDQEIVKSYTPQSFTLGFLMGFHQSLKQNILYISTPNSSCKHPSPAFFRPKFVAQRKHVDRVCCMAAIKTSRETCLDKRCMGGSLGEI